MSTTPASDPALEAVESPSAGPRIIRGGVARALGYAAGTALTAFAFALLLRHLGVADFGRFSTVIAVATIAVGLAEAGLQTLGLRRYVTASASARRELLADILGIRLLLTPAAVLAAALFSVLAGYPAAMTLGSVLAGCGFALVTVSTTFWLPLQINLRFGTVTMLELARQVTIVIAIVVLVALDAGLVPFFAGYLVAGLAMLIPTLAVAGRASLVAPDVDWARCRPILREVAPLALAIALNTLYLKLLVVMCSLLTSERETGLFATASRVTEVLVAVPLFAASAAFPLLAHAGQRDEARLAYAVGRIGEVALLIGGLFAVVLFVGAEPIIRLFAGPGYEDAVPILRLQAFALIGGSLTQAWIYAIVAVRAERSLVAANTVALASVAVLGALLIPTQDAIGAAATAVAGETIMGVAVVVALSRARAELRPPLGHLPRLIVAFGAGLACAALPIPPALAAGVGAIVFAAAAAALGAIPPELATAFRRGR